MPSTNKTPNRGLNSWEGTDDITRADLNADNSINDTWIKHGFFGRSGQQTIPDNTETTVIFTTFDYGCGGTEALKWTDGGNVKGFVIPAGYTIARADISLAFSNNATGVRLIYIYRKRSGAAYLVAAASRIPQVSGSTIFGASKDFPVAEGDIIYATVYQSSGGDLVIASNVTMSVTLF